MVDGLIMKDYILDQINMRHDLYIYQERMSFNMKNQFKQNVLKVLET